MKVIKINDFNNLHAFLILITFIWGYNQILATTTIREWHFIGGGLSSLISPPSPLPHKIRLKWSSIEMIVDIYWNDRQHILKFHQLGPWAPILLIIWRGPGVFLPRSRPQCCSCPGRDLSDFLKKINQKLTCFIILELRECQQRLLSPHKRRNHQCKSSQNTSTH